MRGEARMPRLIPPGPERLAAEPVEDQTEAETDTGTAAAVHEPEKANVPEQASLLKEFSDLFDEPVTNEPTSMRSGMPKDTRHPEAPVHTGGGMRSGSSVSRGEERGIEPNGSGAKGNDGNGLEQRAGRAQDQSAEDCARPDADTLSRGGAGEKKAAGGSDLDWLAEIAVPEERAPVKYLTMTRQDATAGPAPGQGTTGNTIEIRSTDDSKSPALPHAGAGSLAAASSKGGTAAGETRLDLGADMPLRPLALRPPAAEGTSCQSGDGGGGDRRLPQGREDHKADNGRNKGNVVGGMAGGQEEDEDADFAEGEGGKADAGEGDGKEAGQKDPQDRNMPSVSLGEERGIGANGGGGAGQDGGFAGGAGRVDVRGGGSRGGQPPGGRGQERAADRPAGLASSVSTGVATLPGSHIPKAGLYQQARDRIPGAPERRLWDMEQQGSASAGQATRRGEEEMCCTWPGKAASPSGDKPQSAYIGCPLLLPSARYSPLHAREYVDRDQIQRGDTVMVEVAGEKEEVIPRLAKTAGGMPEMADAGRDDKFIHFKEGEMHSKDMNTIDREKEQKEREAKKREHYDRNVVDGHLLEMASKGWNAPFKPWMKDLLIQGRDLGLATPQVHVVVYRAFRMNMLAEEEVLKLPKNTEDARKKAETKIKNAKRAWKELAGFQGNFNDDWDEFVEDDDEQGLIDDMISERDKKSAGASQPERHLQTPQTAAGGSGVGMGQNTQDREEGARAAAAGVVEANGVNADGRGVARDGRGVSGAERMAALGQPAITAAASRGMVPRFDRNGPTSSWRQSPSHLQKDLCFDCPGCGEGFGPYDSQRFGAMLVKHMKPCILKAPDKKVACMAEASRHGYGENLRICLEGTGEIPRASEDGSALRKRPRFRLSKSPLQAAGRAINPNASKRPRKPVIQIEVATSVKKRYKSLREAHFAAEVDRKTMTDAIWNKDVLKGARWYFDDDSLLEDSKCTKCGQNDDRIRDYIACDGCNKEWHFECTEPPISEVPEGTWFCLECSTGEQGMAGHGQ